MVLGKNIDESNINKNEDLANGTHYIMLNATGYKLSGKEKLVSLPVGLKGVEGHDNGTGQPWWYKQEVCVTTTQPTYAMVDISPESIKVDVYTVQGVLTSDTNKNITVHDYGTQTRSLHDTLTISYSERSH